MGTAAVPPPVHDLVAIQRNRKDFWPRIGSQWKEQATGSVVEVLAIYINKQTGEWEISYQEFDTGHCWSILLRKWLGFRKDANGTKINNFECLVP